MKISSGIVILILSTISIIGCKYLIIGSSEKFQNKEAEKLWRTSSHVHIDTAIKYLNIADSIEPNNPIILHKRGLLKSNAGYNIDSVMTDLNRSIDLSSNEKARAIRLLNRGLVYLEAGDTISACRDWEAAGDYADSYTEEYCK